MKFKKINFMAVVLLMDTELHIHIFNIKLYKLVY